MGLWPSALVFDLLANFGPGGNALVRISFCAILAGLVAALAAIPTGLADWLEIKPDKPAWKIAIFHMIANSAGATVWLANLLVRLESLDTARSVSGLALGLSVAGTLLVAFSGYLGGQMVYDQGIGIARTSKSQWRRIAKQGGARLPKTEG